MYLFKVYWQVSRLDVNPNPISFLDDLLLIICLPAFFVYSGLTIIASIDNWEQDDKRELRGSLFTHLWVVRTKKKHRKRNVESKEFCIF